MTRRVPVTVLQVLLSPGADESRPPRNLQHCYPGAVSIRSFVEPKVVIRHRTGAKPIIAFSISRIQILNMRYSEPCGGGRGGSEVKRVSD
jgi:hypothetical protein